MQTIDEKHDGREALLDDDEGKGWGRVEG